MKKLIIANWKSHKNKQEAQDWVTEYSMASGNRHQATVVLCPPFTLLDTAATAIKQTGAQLALGVQTLSPYPAGSYTGGISTRNIEGLGVEYAILGHSERRQYFHETNNDVSKQLDQALSARIRPVICVDKDYISSQAAAIADEVKPRCIIAYEPASSIGGGAAEDVGTVTETIAKIRKHFGDVPILYGGSVSLDNIASYLTVADGVLVGSAALDPVTFTAMLATIE